MRERGCLSRTLGTKVAWVILGHATFIVAGGVEGALLAIVNNTAQGWEVATQTQRTADSALQGWEVTAIF